MFGDDESNHKSNKYSTSMMKHRLPSKNKYVKLSPLLLPSIMIAKNYALNLGTSSINRRDLLSVASKISVSSSIATCSFPTIVSCKTLTTDSILKRLDADMLSMPSPSRANEMNGIDNTYFPTWLEGEWKVTQTLVNTSTPLGLKYIGGPSGSESIAIASLEQQNQLLNKPVNLKLRWVKTKFGIAEDRLFNTKQRLNAFAGRDVVSSVQYADVGGSNRASVIAMGGGENDPLQTTLVYFKGPAAQKTFLLSHGGEYVDDEKTNWAGYEVTRSIFALTNSNISPPVTTDTELIWQFELLEDKSIRSRLRIASYLNAQADMLYFEARNKAVSFADYTLTLVKVD